MHIFDIATAVTVTQITIIMKKFYNRKNEMAHLHKIQQRATHTAQLTFVTGRRRIGKTSLLVKANEKNTFVYFFIAKKNEALLCSEFVMEVQQKLNVPIFGDFKTFRALFGFIMELSKTLHFTLILDEFQEFLSVNPSVYSDMQHIWDSNKDQSKINLIACGSMYSMMTRIFEDAKEPLFGRATQRMHIQAFDIPTIKEIMSDHFPAYSNEDLLAFYMVTGGVAKYVEWLVQADALTLSSILREIFSENSLFLDEGKNVLIDEFGKDYGNYFSILTLIASGKTSRVEIESILNMQTGGFLERLEKEFGLVKKVRPVLAKPNTRVLKYRIHDNFLNFWFRFIYKYRTAAEIGNLDYLHDLVQREYSTYSGYILEKYFIDKLKEQMQFNIIGTYWERNNQNEIDIVAVNEHTKNVMFAEVKRQKSNISLRQLKEKSENLQMMFQGFQFEFRGFSLEDM